MGDSADRWFAAQAREQEQMRVKVGILQLLEFVGECADDTDDRVSPAIKAKAIDLLIYLATEF